MQYDIRVTPEALKAAADWIVAGENMAEVEIVVDDRMLLVEQGDERNAWDTGGEPASEDYLANAPLDRRTPEPCGSCGGTARTVTCDECGHQDYDI